MYPLCIHPRVYTRGFLRRRVKEEVFDDKVDIHRYRGILTSAHFNEFDETPRGRRIGPRNEEIDIDVMLKAAQIYALIALEICDRARP